ncbi:hypothetical protein EZV62_026194 [Acer yangbiense]|uniref:tRNA-uridine aminocarboxypropyltransferase n=1 Tax=Acer yangbiense TaxID=1000413 RepID=A0A5C7GQV5_9ROSI|nr:hypothetical protein EZV62_026194 [Acer yangbiense]
MSKRNPTHIRFRWNQIHHRAAVALPHKNSSSGAARYAASASVQSQSASATSSHTTPIKTSTHIPIVHHPLESQHKLNTARLLSKTLHHVTTHLSRKLLRSHLTHTHQSPSSTTIYLFPPSPGSPAVGLSELKESLNSNGGGDKRNLRLVVFDGTWKHAKEMVKASQGVLEGLGATRVCLDLDVDENSRGETIYNDELLLRKEPFKGCVTTLRRWLGV